MNYKSGVGKTTPTTNISAELDFCFFTTVKIVQQAWQLYNQ